MTDATGVYHGVRVLEDTTGIPGPYAAMFLGDNGADVVKVEAPEGDPYRTDPGFQTINRNKRSVVVDDDTRRALEAAADVIVTDRPGRGAELRAVNPTAVIVTMPPWGERGPLVHAPTSRALLHAATGIAWNQQSYAETPIDMIVPVAAYGTGVLGAIAIGAGLLARLRSGAAPTYEVSQLSGAAAVQLGEVRVAGPPQDRPGSSIMGSKGRVGAYRLIEAADGKWFFLACGTASFYRRMLDVIGRPELIDDPELANPPWGLLTDEAIARITPILDEAFAARPRHEWLEILAGADVPAQPVLTREEFLTTSMVAANDLDVTVEHPELGPVSMMGLPFAVEGAPGAITTPAPLLGAHTDEVVAAWAGTPPPTAPEPEPGAAPAPHSGERPLAGVSVLDLTSFIAGPVVSRYLAMLGAEVIKVEPPTGDPFRAIGPMFISWNQGKRSIAVDLTTPEGLAEFQALAPRADVVVENFRPGVAARLGVDGDSLAAVNPDLVCLSSSGYGRDASMAALPAFDPLIQAMGGLMAAQGGLSGDDRPDTGFEPVFWSVNVHDVVTPMLGALGCIAGLHRRHQTGGGQRVTTSLVQSTMVAQAAEFTRYEGRPPTALGGFDNPGPNGEQAWTDGDDGLMWHDGDHTMAVCTTGLTGSALAEANDLLVTEHHPEFGSLVAFGQLIGGAGAPPHPSPTLDQHGEEIRAELADGAPAAKEQP